VRRWLPAALIGLAAAGLCVLWAWPGSGVTAASRNFNSLAILGGTALLLFLWGLAFSRRRWWFLAGGLLIVAAAVTSVAEFHFTGDMVPVVRFRWQRDRDQALEAHRAGQGPADPVPLTAADPSRADFAEYRGPARDGVVAGPSLARDWNGRSPRLLWRQPSGGGYAQFAVAGNVAVTIEQRRDREAVVCYDAATGKERWAHAYPAHFKERMGGDGPRATPTVAGERLYSLGATGMLVCLELATGAARWSADILEGNSNVPWGMSGSPLVYDDVVLVNPGAQSPSAAGRAVVAYDRETGRVAWSAGDKPAGYSSPELTTLGGRRQVLLFDGQGVAGYDPAGAGELWRYAWETYMGINVAQPLVLDSERVFISSGYDKGCAMLRVTEADGAWQVQPVWENKGMRCKFTSPVYFQGCLYGLDEGILVCLDAASGAQRWREGRYEHGQLLLVNDLLLVQSEKGRLVLLEANPEAHRELGRLQAVEGKTWNPPALAGGKAYVRNAAEMACYELPAEGP
jgi:outer membrane protein assembly factor BamB